MMNLIDLKGERFGKLLVIDRGPNTKDYKARWNCLCDCGNRTLVDGRDLRRGNTKSCGGKRVKERHGMSKTRIYKIWIEMKNRCKYQGHKSYKYYGGKGIDVCPEWKHSFNNFHAWASNNGYSDSLTIDRIDVDKGYSSNNCRWATRKQQNRNKRDTKYIEINGVKLTIGDLADITGLSTGCLRQRIKKFDNGLQPPTRGEKEERTGPTLQDFKWKRGREA